MRVREPIAANEALSQSDLDALLNALGASFVQLGTTRDGAMRLQLTQAPSLDDARAAVNRVRLLPQVLYANLVATITAPVDSIASAKEDQTANISAGAHTLTLRAAQRGNYQVGSQIVRVQVDGVTVGEYQPPSTAYGTYQTPAFVVSTSGTHTVALIGVGGGSDYTAFVDDVRLVSQ